jgi:UDP-glucose 4-epimerase
VIRIIDADITEAELLRDTIAETDIIFNLAGEISHIHSMAFPERDLQVNTVAQLRFLMECKEYARGRRIVYAGTRQIYGVPKFLPVDESHPIQPVDFNGVHKFAAASYHMMLTRAGYLDAVVLRLTNVYGPRMALDAVCQGFLSTFLRRMVTGQQIEIFGDGTQLRDPIYVDDAVEAFLLAALEPEPKIRAYNVGGPEALTVASIAEIASELGGCAPPAMRPFPEDRKPIDIGSYRTDCSRIERDLHWKPQTTFREGLKRTFCYYKKELRHYLDPDQPTPQCRMPEHSTPHRLMYGRFPSHGTI